MIAFLCKTCGCQYGPSDVPPPGCKICEDDRQYVPESGPLWTTLDEMREAGYKNVIREVEPGLHGIGTQPWFAIGQRPVLVQTPHGNVLYDSNSFIDDDTIARVRELGGIAAITASHPHFYGCIIEWSHAFDNAPVYIPREDEQWITRPDPVVRIYESAVELVPGVTLVQTGGHFEGSAVVHWAAGADGRGVLLTGDSIAVAQDRTYVTFMRSFPNFTPLPESLVRGAVEAVRPYAFDRIYGGWWQSVVRSDAKASVERSAERYIRWLKDPPPAP